MTKQDETAHTLTLIRRKRQKQTHKKKPDPQSPGKGEINERSDDALISYLRLCLEIRLRYVGPPVLTC